MKPRKIHYEMTRPTREQLERAISIAASKITCAFHCPKYSKRRKCLAQKPDGCVEELEKYFLSLAKAKGVKK